MIEAIRELALLELNADLKFNHFSMRELRDSAGQAIAERLVEAADKVSRVYLLHTDPAEPDLLRMWVEELDESSRKRLPFNKPSGSQSPAIGPVLKRSYKPSDTPPCGPSAKILRTTRLAFEKLGTSADPWAGYFREISGMLSARTLEFQGERHTSGEGAEDPDVLSAAIRLIPEKETVFLALVDSEGRWPGDRPEYMAYLGAALADIKYLTLHAPVLESGVCPLCGEAERRLYPNAMKGAGFNLGNVDRLGAFPGLEVSDAWKGFGICVDCADLLYIFKQQFLPRFITPVGGEKAFVLPSLLGDAEMKRDFVEVFRDYLKRLDGGKLKSYELELLGFLGTQDDAQLVIHILWANFGQLVEEVRGVVSDVLPSRLRGISEINKVANRWSHALAPRVKMEDADFNLSLSMLAPLFHRPGGRRAKHANASARLFATRQSLISAIYHGLELGDQAGPLLDEILDTARWYLDDIRSTGNTWGLLNEGQGKAGKTYWTLAGWIRHLARFFYYLDLTGGLSMDENPFINVDMEALKPYFEAGSGINSPEKAFAFQLGILYGKLIQVQGARGVNVSSNALTWLKRLNLSGRDLPGLYTKIREKLLAYGVEANSEVRALLRELGHLGARLGDEISLDTIPTCYFLLLGQSVAVEVLPSSRKAEAHTASSNDNTTPGV